MFSRLIANATRRRFMHSDPGHTAQDSSFRIVPVHYVTFNHALQAFALIAGLSGGAAVFVHNDGKQNQAASEGRVLASLKDIARNVEKATQKLENVAQKVDENTETLRLLKNNNS